MQLLARALNSILTRILALTFALLIVTLIVLNAIMQTPVSIRIFDRAIAESAEGIAELVWLLESSPPELEDAILSTFAGQSRVARTSDGFSSDVRPNPARYEVLTSTGSAVAERLKSRDMRFQDLGIGELQELQKSGPLPFYRYSSALQISIELNGGRVLDIWLAPSFFFTQPPYGLIALLILVTAITLILGLSIHWVIMRPIRTLERDAELVGLAETAIPISETGPRELRRLSKALNRMRTRLGSLVREREQIMVAIAHDIRTGLTKLRLRIEGEDLPRREAIETDLDQMEKLLSDMMAYGRAENPMSTPELIELISFAKQLAASAPYEVSIDLDEVGSDFTIAGDRIALTRLFENLLENARRYGGGAITMRITSMVEGLAVQVEDDGPGISPDDLERAFEPFFRAETSRNRSTGGSGLGLGIARAIAHSHGASIELSNLSAGGLCARVFFSDRLKA